MEQTPRQFVFHVAGERGVAQIAGSKHYPTPIAMARAHATDPTLPRRIVIAAGSVETAHSLRRKVTCRRSRDMYKYTHKIEFEWDEAKNQANRRKHRVDFEIAQRIFDGYVLTWIDMRRDYGETRAGAIGRTEGMTLAVIFTRRRHRIRLISARKANRNERTIYEARLEALEQG